MCRSCGDRGRGFGYQTVTGEGSCFQNIPHLGIGAVDHNVGDDLVDKQKLVAVPYVKVRRLDKGFHCASVIVLRVLMVIDVLYGTRGPRSSGIVVNTKIYPRGTGESANVPCIFRVVELGIAVYFRSVRGHIEEKDLVKHAVRSREELTTLRQIDVIKDVPQYRAWDDFRSSRVGVEVLTVHPEDPVPYGDHCIGRDDGDVVGNQCEPKRKGRSRKPHAVEGYIGPD